jgi:hypothetical protein
MFDLVRGAGGALSCRISYWYSRFAISDMRVSGSRLRLAQRFDRIQDNHGAFGAAEIRRDLNHSPEQIVLCFNLVGFVSNRVWSRFNSLALLTLCRARNCMRRYCNDRTLSAA